MALRGKFSVSEITRVGILFSLSAVLSLVEGMIPLSGFLFPGVKLGLSNIPVMVSLMMFPMRDAFLIGVLKSLLVLMMRGPVAGFLSLCGGMTSILIACILLHVFSDRLSCIAIGCSGAIFHNVGQLFGAMLITGTGALVVQLPILVLSGIGMGALTGIVFYLVLPNLYRTDKNNGGDR